MKNEKIRVNSSQYNFVYNGKIHFPYSIASLVAYVKSKEQLGSFFEFEKTFVFRDDVDEDIQKCKNSEILMCSCYVWNWEITTYLAEKVKELNPNCLVIFGGPHVPNYSENFFEKYPFVDILVHGEGELIFEEICDAYLKNRDLSKINGIQTKHFRNPPASRINDLSSLPSPYLTDIVWELVDKRDDIEWVASWETDRGCPYQCTFCDWGSATATKLRKWSDDRLFKEIEWFADNKITYIDCCDANFGIFQERDSKIAQKLKETKLKRQYPETFRTNWAKVSSEKIIPIAKELQSSELLRAVTLSLQSMDEQTLGIIKRANIKFDKFSELTLSFRKNGIPTYTELIMGLPGETIETFKNGFETIISDGNIGSVVVYNCGILPNAPMNEPSYREKYKIQSVRSPIFLAHSSRKHRGIQEYEYIITSTFSFTVEELKQMYIFGWVVQVFFSLGIFEYISKYFHTLHGLRYIDFFETFLDFCREEKSFFSEEYERVKIHADKGYSGKGWNDYDPRFGDMNWPFEESSFLRLILDRKKLSDGIKVFLKYVEKTYEYDLDEIVVNDLIQFQTFLLSTRTELNDIKSEQFNFNWKDFFINGEKLEPIHTSYFYKNPVTEKILYEWAKQIIWFGRFKQKYKFHPENLQEQKFLMNISGTQEKF